MAIQFMWKDSTSGAGDCPALYRMDGGYVVVGKLLDADQLAQVRAVGEAHDSGIGAGESALFVPANVLDRIAGS